MRIHDGFAPGLFALGPAEGDVFGGGQPGVAGGRVQTTAAGFTYTISPTLLLDGNVGYTRQHIGANGDELPLNLDGAAVSDGLIEVTDREQVFTFRDVPSPPTPSLLREFSAPNAKELELAGGVAAGRAVPGEIDETDLDETDDEIQAEG